MELIRINKTSQTSFLPQLMATTAAGFIIAWGPFAGLCVWEMVTQPQVVFVPCRRRVIFPVFRRYPQNIGSLPPCSARQPPHTTPSSTSSCPRGSGWTQRRFYKGFLTQLFKLSKHKICSFLGWCLDIVRRLIKTHTASLGAALQVSALSKCRFK